MPQRQKHKSTFIPVHPDRPYEKQGDYIIFHGLSMAEEMSLLVYADNLFERTRPKQSDQHNE